MRWQRLTCCIGFLMLCPTLAAIIRGGTTPQDPTVEQLRSQVTSLTNEGRYGDILTLLAEPARSENSDDELRQYALLTIGETYLLHLHKADKAIKPLEALVSDFFKNSPYVGSAHYYLGSHYLEVGNESKAFLQLSQVSDASPHYKDARFKLEWSSRHFRNVIRLPLGLQVSERRFRFFTLSIDLLFLMLWTFFGIVRNSRPSLAGWLGTTIGILLAIKISISLFLALVGS